MRMVSFAVTYGKWVFCLVSQTANYFISSSDFLDSCPPFRGAGLMPKCLSSLPHHCRRETEGAAETQPRLLDLPLFLLHTCPVLFPSPDMGAINYNSLLVTIYFLPSCCRTRMDAKKPGICSLTSFPNLKVSKQENLTSGKVRILEFYLGRRSIHMKILRHGTQWRLLCPSTLDGRRQQGKTWEDQANWQSQVWVGLEGKSAGGPKWFHELQNCKALTEQPTCI